MTNSVRPCVACQVFDDHPRHVIADPANPRVALTEELMHMDCCRDVRGCAICREVLSRVEHQPGIVGDELRQRLVAAPALQVEHADGDPFGAVLVRA